jgi:hypothetical protein
MRRIAPIGKKRGVTGVVTKNSNEITLKTITLMGVKQTVVTVTDKTKYKRYAPDSVTFADAKKSRLEEIGAGDQVRARPEERGRDGGHGGGRGVREFRDQGGDHHGGGCGREGGHGEGSG